jgi:hypothetical protein
VHHTTVLNWCKNIIPTGAHSPVGKTESSDGKQRPSEMPTTDEIIERRAEVGEWLGVDEKTIRNWYKEIPGAELSAPGKKRRSYRQIGRWLGVDPKTAWNWVDESPTVEHSTAGKTEGDDGKQYPTEPATPNNIKYLPPAKLKR